VFPQNAHYSDSTFSEIHLYHAKSEGRSRPLNHRKSDSYAAAAAQRRSAGAGISDPEGGGASPGCRPQAFPVRPPRCDGDPDRLPHGLRAFVRSIFEAIIDIFDDLGLKRDQPRVRLPPPCTSKVLLKGWHFDPDAGPLKLVVKNRANATGGEDFAWDNEH